MATRWEQKLRSFQRGVEALWAFSKCDLHYGVVYVHGPVPAPGKIPQASIYAAGGSLAESLVVPITDDDYQFHLLFGMDFAPVKAEFITEFKSLLRELHDVYPMLPRWVPTPLRLRAIANGGDENLVRWGLTLLSLGATEQKVFRCETEFAESADSFQINGRVAPWETLSPVPGFDPVEFVTRRGERPREWPFWKQEHATAGRTFPEVLAFSLTKPILYASVNAVDLLIQIGLEQRPQSNRRRRPSRVTRDGTELTDADLSVLSALRKYHQGKDGVPNFKILKQREIEELAGVSQESAHRTLKNHFCRLAVCRGLTAKKCYAKLCEERLILDMIDHIDSPTRREELTNIRNIDQFRAKGNASEVDDSDDEMTADDGTDDE